MKTLTAFILCMATPLLPRAAAQGLLMLAGSPTVYPSVTQDFNSYTAGVALSTLPGWTTLLGQHLTVAGGGVSSNSGAGSLSAYSPAGFDISSDHEAEVLYVGTPASTGVVFQGAAVAIQPDGSCYWSALDRDGRCYTGRGAPGDLFAQNFSVQTAVNNIPAGSKVRVSVTGTAPNRVVTTSYDVGAGWVTPPQFVNSNYGAPYQFEGGKAGLAGYYLAGYITTDALTIRNINPVTEVTQDFNSYTAGVSLATVPNWTVPGGAFVTVAGGTITGTGASGNVARYTHPGFTVSPNHEVEGTYAASAAGGAANYGAVAAAVQTDGRCYYGGFDVDGTIYFGITGAGGAPASWIYVSTPGGIAAGSKYRLLVTGSGTSRRVTGSYNIGAGWVTPPTFLNKDWGSYWDGGVAGLHYWNGAQLVKVDSITVRNKP